MTAQQETPDIPAQPDNPVGSETHASPDCPAQTNHSTLAACSIPPDISMNNNELSAPPVIEAANIFKYFTRSSGYLSRKRQFAAVSDVTLTVHPGKTVGIIGESGCGKSTLAKILAGLLSPDAGSLRLHGRDISAKSGRSGLAPLPPEICKTVQMVFQDPNASLNPRIRIGESVGEPLRCLYPHISKSRRQQAVQDILTEVGIAPENASRYPHAFSGGQRQRIAIARALIARPSVIICDEPTSSLDSSVQAQVLNLLDTLQQRNNLAYIFISHDLAVVRHMSDTVAVMFSGSIVEEGPVRAVFSYPAHPYTRMLLNSIPSLTTFRTPPLAEPAVQSCLTHARGEPAFYTQQNVSSNPSEVPAPSANSLRHDTEGRNTPATAASGHCPYVSLCPRADSICQTGTPPVQPASSAPQHLVRCFHHQG